MLEIAQKIDWREIEAETSRLLSRLVGFDTSNPPGETTDAAKLLFETLLEESVFATLVPGDGAYRNLVAQVEGSGKQEPLLLTSPLDVAGADQSNWGEFKPFSGYDDGRHIWGRGTLAAKSLVAAQTMTLVLIRRMGIPLARHLRFAAYADGFSAGGRGLEYIVENHLPLIDARTSLSWAFPPSVEIDGKTVFFLHRTERAALRIVIRAESKQDALGGSGDAADVLLEGIRELRREFASDFGEDRDTRALAESLARVAGDSGIAELLISGDSKAGSGLLPQTLIDYAANRFRTDVSVLRLSAGSYGYAATGSAEAELLIRPCPGLGLEDCANRAVMALEGRGDETPYIGSVDYIEGSGSEPDEELNRIILAACRSVSPEAEVIYGINPFPGGLHLLRNVGIETFGFNPMELPDGIADASRRVFGADERVVKTSLGRMVRVIFETCVRFCS